jgi:hypothetical protein
VRRMRETMHRNKVMSERVNDRLRGRMSELVTERVT